MKLIQLQSILDNEFGVKTNQENLVDFAVTPENKKFINSEFIERKTGLMTKCSDEVQLVFTAVFITNEIISQLDKYSNVVVVTHHNFNYFEDKRGLQSIDVNLLEKLAKNNNSIYVAHAPLDTHQIYGTSKCLAELCDVKIESYFYDYFGSPTALIGKIEPIAFDNYTDKIMKKLERPFLTIEKYTNQISNIAVVAGGGDLPDLLQQVYDLGCDTLLTGTVEHLWDVPFIQEGNKKFHELNKKLKVNLIGGTHFGTERPAMVKLTEFFKKNGIDSKYLEDYSLLNFNKKKDL